MKQQRKPLASILICIGILLPVSAGYSSPHANAQTPSASFPETGYTIQGIFLDYWNEHGGLAQFGYPISGELEEVSQQDNGIYTVQYFERAVFERHPENEGTPYEVLLSLLGAQHYLEYYGPDGASNQRPNLTNPIAFPETGHTIGGPFRAYWEQHGGLAQQGYPISDEFEAVSTHDGKTYTVQYFERAVFELHPENKGTEYEVLLAPLGTDKHRAKHSSLIVPAPIPPAHLQINSTASERYLLWGETRFVPFNQGNPLRTNYLAMDLATSQVISVTTSTNSAYPSVSGSIAVWSKMNGSCRGCESDIVGKDLITGATFSIATGPSDQRRPKIAGKIVTWLEWEGDNQRIMLQDIYERESVVLATNSEPSNTYLSLLAMSDEYVIWVKTIPDAIPPVVSYSKVVFDLYSYNLQTSQREVIGHGTLNVDRSVKAAVSGRYAVWTDSALHLTELTTNQTVVLRATGADNPVMRGNTIIWTEDLGTAIWGMKLSDRIARWLLSNVREPVIARDWLVYTDNDQLIAISLIEAFNAARQYPATHNLFPLNLALP